jgi:hypothetical protein
VESWYSDAEIGKKDMQKPPFVDALPKRVTTKNRL